MRKEEYLCTILDLEGQKGYIQSKDIVEAVRVSAATVSGMLASLAEDELIIHERYGGIALTERGVLAAGAFIRSLSKRAEYLQNNVQPLLDKLVD